MTDDRLPLVELAAKSGDPDFLRAIAESVLQLIMTARSYSRNYTTLTDATKEMPILPTPKWTIPCRQQCDLPGHAERPIHKLMPATPKQARAVVMIRDLVWCFHKALKVWKRKPSPGAANAFRRRFDQIFILRTGYDALDHTGARKNYWRFSSDLRYLSIPMPPRTICVPA